MLTRTRYQDVLKRKLEERCQANPRYSLRAFARDLGVGSGRLSLILSGKRGLSAGAAEAIAARLGFSDVERESFVAQVSASDARSKKARDEAARRFDEYRRAGGEALTLQLDSFRVISDWYHFALLELTTVRGFVSEPAWVARRLGISRVEAENAIDRLKRLELLHEKSVRGRKRLVLTRDSSVNPSGVPSEAIRKFHAQVLRKAIDAISLQSVDERDLSALTVAIDSRDVPELKQAIKDFRRSFNARTEAKRSGRDEVYCLGIQFFRLTETEKETRS